MNGVLGICEYAACFCFGSGGDDILEGFAEDVDDAVEAWADSGRAFVTEIEDAGNSAAGFGEDEVRCVGFDVEDHVDGVVAELGVWVSV